MLEDTESSNKGQTIHRFACCALRGFNNKQDRKQDRQHCSKQRWFILDSNSSHARVANTQQMQMVSIELVGGTMPFLFMDNYLVIRGERL